MKRFSFFALAALSAVAFAQAQEGFPISTDRPSFSDGTLIIPKGRWQIETGYTFTKIGDAELQTFGELLFRLPIHEKVELRLLNVTFAEANSAGGSGEGMLDPGLGFKYRIQAGAQRKSPDMALVAQATVPAGADEFRIRRNQPTVKWAGYYQADSSNGYGWNLVWSHLGKGSTEFHQWAVSGYWAKSLNTRSGIFVEVYHLMPSSKGGSHSTFTDAGMTYMLDKATQVDFRIGSGFKQSRDGWFVGAGIAYRF